MTSRSTSSEAPRSPSRRPLARDAIFRIASLSKPITAATTMSLVEEGILRLDQAIDDLVPELADRQVLRAIDAELDDTVAAGRSITVEDLLTSTMGFGSVMALQVPIQSSGPRPSSGCRASVGRRGLPAALDPDQWIAALGSLPLLCQPGERWLYNTSVQVLGVLLARAAGKDLGDVMRERIFEPLGMVDTGFTVPGSDLDRLTTFYLPDRDTGELTVVDAPPDSWWSRPPSFPDASGWLVSTIDDLWTFVSMLLGGGTARGRRVLSERSVALMTTDRLTPAQRADSGLFLGDHGSWGFGMAAPARGSTGLPLPSGFGWDGGSGTTWRSNAERGVTGILLTQRQLNSPQPPPVFEDFWSGVNAATR